MSLRERSYLSEGSCPVRNQMYGGMPGGGGYGSSKEYEVGAQRMAEAAHCLLGSFGKLLQAKDYEDWKKYEKGHIKEEMGIISKVQKEYGKSVYTDQINYPTKDYLPQYHEQSRMYVKKAIESIRKNSPKLKAVAKREQGRLKKGTMPMEIYMASYAAYDLLQVLAREMEKSVKWWPDKEIMNAFRSSDMVSAVARLERLTKAIYGGKL